MTAPDADNLRILHAAYWSTNSCLGLANESAKRNQVMFITSRSGVRYLADDGWRELFDPRIVLRVEAGLSRKQVLGYPQRIIGLLQGVYRFHPDVMHVQEHADSFLNKLLRRIHGVPMVLTVHDPQPHLGVGEKFLRYYAPREKLVQALRRRADWIIVYADHVKSQLLRFQPELSADRVTVIMHGPGDYIRKWVRPEYEERDGTALLFGVVRGQKGLGVLLDAWPKVTRNCPNARLVVAGTGADLPNHRDRIITDPTCELMDWRISTEDMARLFTEASVVVLPYLEATQSGPLAIAIAFGKPVVASSVGGLPEMVDDNESGLIVPPGDPEALADALIRALRDKSLREHLSEGTRKLRDGRLSWETIAHETEEVYRRAIEFHHRRRTG